MKRYAQWLITLALMLAIMALWVLVDIGCNVAEIPTNAPAVVEVGVYGVQRFTDLDGQVTCWIYHSHKAGGVSCIPTQDIGQ